jgi:hypothetical protein
MWVDAVRVVVKQSKIRRIKIRINGAFNPKRRIKFVALDNCEIAS